MIHGKWGVDAETGKVHVSRLSARGKLKVSVEPVSVEEIREMAGFIVKTGQALFSLIMKAGTTNSPPHSGQ